MRESTQQRYQRIQAFYRRLSKAKLSHEFCLEILCDFFNVKNPRTIERVIVKELGEIEPYEHQDLDRLWIDGRIRKHLEAIAPTADLELNNPLTQESTEQ
ncbi:hypothetical protein [Aureispira sp. CCB-QB1]|uniref:hypothetical protein n=1 Tax=Aureispira sp. CCB-QB1 TaxID=1313421 RepID=UPI0012DDF405|nr:hypothetical protein [Aureispira sp. CCB-QB1]